jgi:hypothetical protein
MAAGQCSLFMAAAILLAPAAFAGFAVSTTALAANPA